MNERILDDINSTVQKEDEIYFLGDFAMGYDIDNQVPKLREKIKCQTIHLILGNHDKRIEKNRGLRDVFSTVQHYLELSYKKQLIVMFHFPLQVWNRHASGALHLFGHSHGTFKETSLRKRQDVGWDVYNKPQTLDFYLDLLSHRGIEYVDHHDN